jgi:hypothetical protein
MQFFPLAQDFRKSVAINTDVSEDTVVYYDANTDQLNIIYIHDAVLQVFTAETIKCVIFWDVTQCGSC